MREESSPAPPVPLPMDPALEFIQVWATSAAQVLGQIASSPFPIDCLSEIPAEAPGPGDGDVHAIIVAAGTLRGEMGLRLPRSRVLAAAQLLLGEAQDPAAELKPDHREAAEELLRQVAGHATTSLKPRWGEVQVRVETGMPASWPPGAAGWLGAGSGAPFPLLLEWQLSAALQTALTSFVPATSAPSGAPTEQAESLPQNREIVAGNLDLLMDVELEVMLRFGQRLMELREILELGAGSVVELDRKVDEPADLLLDGKLIARGEVVVVDGNYGLRILEVMPAQLPA